MDSRSCWTISTLLNCTNPASSHCYHPIDTTTLYDGFIANQDIRGSDAHTVIDFEANISEVPSFANSTDRAKTSGLIRVLGAADKEALHPQQRDAYRLKEYSDDDGSDNGYDWEVVDAEDNIEVDMFPDFVDCVCLSCLGYKVSEILGNHHNTERLCNSCKPTVITGVNHRVPRMKLSGGRKRTKQETKALINYSPLLSPLCPPAALRIFKKTHDSKEENLNNQIGYDMKNSRYRSGTNEDVLNNPRLCEKLAAMRIRINEQREELLTPWPVYRGFKRTWQHIESNDGSEDSIPASALERTTLQTNGQRKSLPAGMNKGGILSREGQDEQYLMNEETVVNRWTAPATIVATAEPQTSLPAAPVTPENQIWHDGEGSWKERNKAMKIAFAAQGRCDLVTPESEVDPEAESDPFITVDELTSQSIEMNARRAAFNARLSQKFVDWINHRAAHRGNNSRSPTPVARAGASEEWRTVYRARQAKLVQVSPAIIRPTHILGLRKTSSPPALSPSPSPPSDGAKEPKRVLADPVVATSQPPQLCAEIDRPRANQSTRILAKLTQTSSRLSDPHFIVEHLCATDQGANFASMCHAAERDDRLNRDFFKHKKKSRFSDLFENLRVVKR